jgi:hypothetical protein
VLAVVLAMAAVAVDASGAHANGRFPQAQRLLEHLTDANRLYLAGTYGLLLTEDRGRNWYYVCEIAFAGKFLEGDPLLDVLPDGRLLGGIFETENLSDDCGCTWTTVLGESATEIVIDVSRDTNDALVAVVRDDALASNRLTLFESMDSGRTWRKLSDLPAQVTDAYTVEVAPSDAARIYVSAFQQDAAKAVLLVSVDRGATWETRDIPGASAFTPPFIAAVHPGGKDRIFVRLDNWDDTAEFTGQDGLLYSGDGGKSWTEVLHRQAKLYGFALSPDGRTVLAGYGDPIESGGRNTNADDHGIYKASTEDLVFEKIHAAMVSCLRWTATGVYACFVPFPRGMAVGFAPSADFTLATSDPFTSLLDLENVRGPLACVASACTETWAAGVPGTAPVCQLFGADCNRDTAANRLGCSGGGGMEGKDGGATAGVAGGGCGCGQIVDPGGGSGLAGIALVVGWAIRRSLRRRRPFRARLWLFGRTCHETSRSAR